jgi:hypothetical protein
MIGALFHSSEMYKHFLTHEFDGVPVDDTDEILHACLEFRGGEPLGFCNQTYLNSLWNVVSSFAPPGLAPSVIDLTMLDFYKVHHQGWFDGTTAKYYGYHIFKEIPDIIKEMKRNITTRRAVIRMPADSDTCLLSIQFTFRMHDEDNGLIPVFTTTANFRSSDAIYGLPADFWMLRKLTDLLMPTAIAAEAFPGFQSRIVINAESFHIYDRDRHLVAP